MKKKLDTYSGTVKSGKREDVKQTKCKVNIVALLLTIFLILFFLADTFAIICIFFDLFYVFGNVEKFLCSICLCIFASVTMYSIQAISKDNLKHSFDIKMLNLKMENNERMINLIETYDHLNNDKMRYFEVIKSMYKSRSITEVRRIYEGFVSEEAKKVTDNEAGND